MALTLLSRRFVWGEGHDERPIVTAIALQGLIGVGFLIAAGLIVARRIAIPLWMLLAVAVAARLVLLPSNLIQESDCYRYVLDGEAILHGVNPFRHSPDSVLLDAEGLFRDALGNDDARLIVARINHSHLRTIYPPLAELAFAAGAALTPWHWRGQRMVFLAFDLAVVALLVWGLARLGRPVGWVALYAWNPLVLKEIANSAHLDSLAAFFILLLCLTLALETRAPSSRGAVLAAVYFSAAVLSKIYPALLAPLCVGALARGRGGARRVALFAGLSSLLIVVAIAPFLTVGRDSLLEALSAFSTGWLRNAGAYALLEKFAPAPRAIAATVTCVVAIAAAVWVWRARDAEAARDRIVDAFQATLLAWFLFLPVAFPWYAVGLLAVCALRPRAWAFVLSVVFALYYLLFLYEYREFSDRWVEATTAVEHVAVWVALFASAVVCYLRRRAARVNS